MTRPIIVVEWDDAHGNSDMFNDVEVDHKPYRFTTVGYLVKSDTVGISIAREFTVDGVLRDHHFIPRQMVVTETLVKGGKRESGTRQRRHGNLPSGGLQGTAS